MQSRFNICAVYVLFDLTALFVSSSGCYQENCGRQDENGKRDKGQGEEGSRVI